jgi:hypothetical protein
LHGAAEPVIRAVHIFDFDGTLFRSGEPPAWWPKGKGWWGSPASLDPPCVPERPGAEWWIGSTVADAKASISDPEVYSVLLTGRLAARFDRRVRALLSQAGLHFDEVILTPGGGTLPFKLKIIERLLAQNPDLKHVQMWDDRVEHISVFEKALATHGIDFKVNVVRATPHDAECAEPAARVAARHLRRRQ